MNIPIYSVQELKKKVKLSVRAFKRKDLGLVKLKAHEQAISHRIAYYLENLFYKKEKLRVDCEYNKHLDVAKSVDVDMSKVTDEELKICGCSGCKKLLKRKPIKEKLLRPDIILHSRGNDSRNLIAIEIKTAKPCPFDKAKLIALTKTRRFGGKYEYQLGVFLHFPKGNPDMTWFPGGKH